MGSISFREFIRWLPQEASEPTSTIVLTSPERRFVDIRVIRPEFATENWPTQEEKLPLDRLDWAIAGTSSSIPTSEQDVTKGQWRHWVSSRTKDTENLCDEGYNHLRPDGKTLEKGSMVNPETGLDTKYEELWRDEDPMPTASQKVKTIVLRLEKGDDTKGLVILLGAYCQALLRRGDDITAERWQWAQSGGWGRTIKIGDDVLPCPEIMEEISPSCGELLAVGSDSWQVVEFSKL